MEKRYGFSTSPRRLNMGSQNEWTRFWLAVLGKGGEELVAADLVAEERAAQSAAQLVFEALRKCGAGRPARVYVELTGDRARLRVEAFAQRGSSECFASALSSSPSLSLERLEVNRAPAFVVGEGGAVVSRLGVKAFVVGGRTLVDAFEVTKEALGKEMAKFYYRHVARSIGFGAARAVAEVVGRLESLAKEHEKAAKLADVLLLSYNLGGVVRYVPSSLYGALYLYCTPPSISAAPSEWREMWVELAASLLEGFFSEMLAPSKVCEVSWRALKEGKEELVLYKLAEREAWRGPSVRRAPF